MELFKNIFNRDEIMPFTASERKQKGGYGFTHKGVEYVHHSPLHHSETAYQRLSGPIIVFLLALLAVTVALFLINWQFTLLLLVTILTTLYFADLLFNLFLITKSFSSDGAVRTSDRSLSLRNNWPRYTVLCPLYKEWAVVPQFVKAMSNLDYPKNKLQVMLLLEEDDQESIKNIQKMDLPSYFDIVIVPDSKPKTKPKACNYGLKFATGEYTVIYDAEDVPDTKQLKKAVIAFETADKRVICVQAKLNFYNPSQNLLSRIFTAEYSLWFDLVLTGMQAINAPIPLGGTSNHFRKADLIRLKGWDSFNVTEDCDLGMRLVKLGYRTAIIDSVTLEEANSDTRNWFAQRTRWIKGYIQTYFLHMRNPHHFARTIREPHFLTFQLVVGGKIISTLVNPFMWLITIAYFLFRNELGGFIDSLYLTPIFYMGAISLFLGNFLYLYYYMVGCAKHGHYDLVKYTLLVPIYWLGMSLASWVSVYKFIKSPHYWSKTRHGLHLGEKKAAAKTFSFTNPWRNMPALGRAFN